MEIIMYGSRDVSGYLIIGSSTNANIILRGWSRAWRPRLTARVALSVVQNLFPTEIAYYVNAFFFKRSLRTFYLIGDIEFGVER